MESEKEPKKYELTTIADIFDKIPEDRLSLCMEEITVLIAEAMAYRMAGLKVTLSTPIVWTDDDNRVVQIKILPYPPGER